MSRIWLSASDVRIVETHIETVSQEIAKVYEKLPDSARAEALRLGHALSALSKVMAKKVREEL